MCYVNVRAEFGLPGIDLIITRSVKDKVQGISLMCMLFEGNTAENADIPPYSTKTG